MANPRFTRRHMMAVVSFAAVFVLLFLSLDRLLFNETFFSPVWMRLREEKKAPQVLIMGNSHAFCSFLPEIINETLGVDSAVLGTSGQNSASVADGFEAVVRVDAPEIAVIELNPFLGEYDAMESYHKASALNYINGMPHLIQRVKSAWHQFGFENIPQGAFQLLRADLMWTRWNGNTEIVFSPDGSAPLGWHATGDYDAKAAQDDATAYYELSTPAAPESRHEREFRRVLQLAAEHEVQVVLVKTPLIHTSQPAVDCITGLKQIAQEYGDTVLGMRDFHTSLSDMGIRGRDFYDSGHLSHSGAARFSIAFSQWLGELTGREPDFQNAFAYAGETVEQLPDGRWRYTMHALGANVEYRFTNGADQSLLKDWSSENFIDLQRSDAEELHVSMRRAGSDEIITQTFMTASAYVH